MAGSVKDQKVHDEAVENFRQCIEYYSEEYSRGEQDNKFLLGDQWPEDQKKRRIDTKRPMHVENKLLPFRNRTVNSVMRNKPSIIVQPVDSQGDIKVADLLKNLIRNIEIVSDAQQAYATMCRNAYSMGYGYLRVNTRYIDDTFDKELIIQGVEDIRGVFLDPMHQHIDGQDAQYGFAYEDMSLKDFERKFPKADASTVDEMRVDGWYLEDTIRVAEYYYKHYKPVKLYNTNYGVVREDDLRELNELGDINVEVFEERVYQEMTVKYCKLSGSEIIEKQDWPGIYIPIIPMYGDLAFEDGRRKSFSMIHQAKDPQRMFNYLKTQSIEVATMQPKAPYVGYIGQFETMREAWQNSNQFNFPFLEVDAIEVNNQPAPLPRREMPPQGSGSLFNEAMASAEGIKAALGIYDAALGAPSNERSGTAIRARQSEADDATFHFVDNFATGLKQVATVLVDLIPKVYTGPRMLRIFDDDGKMRTTPVNQPFLMRGDQEQPIPSGMDPALAEGIYDLNLGKYDVVVDVGPSSQTKRQETVQAILEVARHDPRMFDVAGDYLMKSLDIPYSQEISERMKAIMNPAVLTEDPQAAQLVQAQEVIQQLQAQMEQMAEEIKKKADNQEFKNQIEVEKVKQDAEKLQLETLKTLAEIQKMQQETKTAIPAEAFAEIVDAVLELRNNVVDVEGAVDAMLSAQENVRNPGQVAS